MKYKSIILSICFLINVSGGFAASQGACMPQSWLGEIGQKAKEKVEKRVGEKVDKAMDKTLDKAEEEAVKGTKKATATPAKTTTRKTISLDELDRQNDQKMRRASNAGRSVGKVGGQGGCEILFPTKQGARREMTIYDAKGKVTGTIRQQVQSVLTRLKG